MYFGYFTINQYSKNDDSEGLLFGYLKRRGKIVGHKKTRWGAGLIVKLIHRTLSKLSWQKPQRA